MQQENERKFIAFFIFIVSAGEQDRGATGHGITQASTLMEQFTQLH